MGITIDMEGLRIGVGEIMEQAIITGITRDIGNTMIGIDGDMEMDGENFSDREKLLRRMADTVGGKILRKMERRMDHWWDENKRQRWW